MVVKENPDKKNKIKINSTIDLSRDLPGLKTNYLRNNLVTGVSVSLNIFCSTKRKEYFSLGLAFKVQLGMNHITGTRIN